MLYRHFPKIANRTFSIISLDLCETESKTTAEEILTVATESGVNLYRAGSNTEHCSFLSACVNKLPDSVSLTRILDFTGNSTTHLASFLKETDTGKPDLLLIHLNSETDIADVLKSKVLTDIEKATDEGRLLGAGFLTPPVPALMRKAISAWSGWKFYSTTFNYLHEDILPVITEASLDGLTVLASNPFENGALEQAPAQVHEIFRNAKVPRRHDEWTLRGIWEQQEVTSALCKMDSVFLTSIRCILAETGRPNSLPAFEQETLRAAAREFKELTKNP